MQNYLEKTEELLLRRRPFPLADRKLDNLPRTSMAATAISASAFSATSAFQSCQLDAEDPLELSSCESLEEPEFSVLTKPKGSASKRSADPDYNPRAKVPIGERGMLTRGQLKREQAKLLGETPAPAKISKDLKPKPRPVPALRRFQTGQRIMPTVWHSGNVCPHALGQIWQSENRKTLGNDVERWRAIEKICLDLRDIHVRGPVGVLKGPVSFEDVFEVLGLDEQGEPLVEVQVDSPAEEEIEVVSPSYGCYDIEKYLIPPLVPIEIGRRPAREPKGQKLKGEPKSVAKNPRAKAQKKTTKSTSRRR